jgi:hypothetical protein
MSTSGDLREALTQRLKRLEATSAVRSSSVSSISGLNRGSNVIPGGLTSPSGNLASSKGQNSFQPDSRRSMSLPGVSQISFTREPSVSPSPAPVAPKIRCEGYLSKYSSGSITGRWQKRYFVLEDGRLGYYKKAPGPDSRGSVPDKSFSLRKVKEIIWNESLVNERDFSIKFTDSQMYQLKAYSPSEMRKWVSALSTALAQKDSLGHSDDEDRGSSSGVDLVSVSNSVSSQASDSTIMNEDIQAYLQQQRQMVQASSAARKQDTVWEVEVDPDELDSMFVEWFKVSEDDDDLKRLSQNLIKGIHIATSHLYSTIGSEVFDAQVLDLKSQLKRARSTLQSIRKSETVDPIKTQLNSIIMEYVSRIVNEVVKFLDNRKEIRDCMNDINNSQEIELLGVVDVLCQIMTEYSSLTVATKSDCSCAYCSPIDRDGETCSATDRWKKTLRNILQRLGSELEVTVIERLQNQFLALDSTWDAEAGSSPRAPTKVSHPLFGTRLNVWLTAWSPSLIIACEKEVFNLLKDQATIRHSKRLVSELLASVLVAILNSAWRQFKRKTVRSQMFAETWKQTLKQIAYIRETNTGFWAVFSSQHHEIDRLENSVPVEETHTLALPNLVALGNESILLSTFLNETLPDKLPYVPRIFLSCFEGLAASYSNTATEVAALIVDFHFTEKYAPEMGLAFKSLLADLKRTPMIVARDATEKFASDLIPFGTHPALKSHLVNLLPAAVIQLYVTALLKQRPRAKQMKTITSILETDLIIFKSLFSETRFNCKDSVVLKATLPLQVVISFLSERNKQNILDECGKKFMVAFGTKFALQAANALMEIRGNDFTKSERASLLSLFESPHERGETTKAAVAGSLSRTETASYLSDAAETVWRL